MALAAALVACIVIPPVIGLVLPRSVPNVGTVLPRTEVTPKVAAALTDKFIERSRQYKDLQGAISHQLAALDLAPDDPGLLRGVLANVAKSFPDLAIDLVRQASERQSVPKAVVKAAREEVQKALGGKTYKQRVKQAAALEKNLVLPELPVPRVMIPFAPVVVEFEEDPSRSSVEATLLGPELREQMAEGILKFYAEAISGARASASGRELNNMFYDHQMRSFRSTGKPLVSSLPGFEKLELSMRSAAADLLRRTGMPDSEISHRVTAGMSIFASVHGAGSEHRTHHHFGDAVSGVFYLRVPSGAGRLVFSDPRGASYGSSQEQKWAMPPFHRPFAVDIKEGKLFAWPGWLPHAVEQGGDIADGQYRVSVTFDLEGDWQDTASTAFLLPTVSDGGGTEGRDPKAPHPSEL